MKYLLKLSIATVLSFGVMQSVQWWRALDCNDCALKYGFPFHFRQTEGFATGPRFLWVGLTGDLAIALAVAVTLMWAVRLIRSTKSK